MAAKLILEAPTNPSFHAPFRCNQLLLRSGALLATCMHDICQVLCLLEVILPVSLCVHILQCGEIQEMLGPVHLVVELLGIGQLQAILHIGLVLDALEVVVPAAHIWNHVEAHEPAGKASILSLATNVLLNKRISSKILPHPQEVA